MATTSNPKSSHEPRFPIPLSLHDLEREPYHLLPYPENFEHDDETARANSFAALVQLLEQGNRTLQCSQMALFVIDSDDDDEDDPWMENQRMQALYTLVR
jgi:hypothetical protein